MAAFAAAVNGAALKVTRSVLLARAGAGAELRTSQLLQELVRQLPSDQFRTCLAQARQPLLLQCAEVQCACMFIVIVEMKLASSACW